MNEQAIQIQQLTKWYDGLKALDLPFFSVPPGQSLGVVGNNGAGKTTLFSLLLDLLRPSSGQIWMCGHPVQGNEGWKRSTGAFLDDYFLIDFLTPEEYFEFVAELYGMDNRQRESALTKFERFFRGEVLGTRKLIRDLSAGNRKKVGIAAALLPTPEVVILDEPFPGLDPTSVIRLNEIIREMHVGASTTFLISSHQLPEVTEACDRIVILEEGIVVRDLVKSRDTLAELEAYFGR